MTILPRFRACHEERCRLSEFKGGHCGRCGHFPKCLSSNPLVSEDFSYLSGFWDAFAICFLRKAAKTAKTAKLSSCADRECIDA